MAWLTEWRSISSRIQGLKEATDFFVQFQHQDGYGVAKKELIPHAQDIYKIIKQYHTFNTVLTPHASTCLDSFFNKWDQNFVKEYSSTDSINGLKTLISAICSLNAEITYHLSDIQAISQRKTERAFIHLQRSLMVDDSFKNQWEKAFEKGETACEKLGAVHLLLHGIWAFKAYAAGGRTDLILGEPLTNLSQVKNLRMH